MAIRSPAMRQHCTGRQAGHAPGRYCAPAGARKPCGLQGNGLPHQRARWFAMTGLGVRWVGRQRGGSGKLTAGASLRPTVRVSAMHPAQRTRLRSCTRRAGARPRRTPANLPGPLAPAGHQQICLAPSPQRTRPPNLSLRGAKRRGNPSPKQCERIAPAVRPVMRPGLYGAPDGARKPWGLRGNGLPHQRRRWFAMTDLGARWVWMECRDSGRRTAGARPPPYGAGPVAHPSQHTRPPLGF